MPAFPAHIAVVTSANGAALHDVIRTARQRWAGIRLTLIDVRVQGAAAAPEIAAAIDALSRRHTELAIDALIVTRGGGSLEDLWAFNERVVADAIFRCEVPIAAAIGHETDTTIAELVADLRCSTPTQAAARLVPDSRAERQRVAQAGSRLNSALRRRAEHARVRLEKLSHHQFFRRPADMCAAQRQRLDHLTHRLEALMQQRMAKLRDRLATARHAVAQIEPMGCMRLGQHRLHEAHHRLIAAGKVLGDRRRQRLDELERVLKAVGPQNVLRRGYSYTTDAAGSLIQSAHQLSVGDRIVTHLSDGQVESQVVGEEAPVQSQPRAAAATTPPRPRRSSRTTSATASLFDSTE